MANKHKPKCPSCGVYASQYVYDGGNGEGARIKIVYFICEKCAKVVTIKSKDLPAK
jgi:hypothetical protein